MTIIFCTTQPFNQLDLIIGADYLVIGRPITAHRNPSDAVKKILEEFK